MRLAETWYPPTWRGRPASMPWGDWQIWQRFVESPAALYDSYAYDVMIHIDAQIPPDLEENIRRMWLENTAKRVDVVARKAEILTVIEVRELTTWQTMGQVLGYQTLFAAAYAEEQLSPPMIVTGGVAAGIEPAIRAQNITLTIV